MKRAVLDVVISALAAASAASAACSADAGKPAAPSAPAPSSSAPAEPRTTSCDDGASVPASASELGAWLRTRAYTCWDRETRPHASAGPHGGNVQTYVNRALYGSLEAGAAEHPKGSVAVKELHGQSGDVATGWAVMVKTQPASDGGGGWYWYEVFDTAPGASAIEGQGKALCANCHAGSGRDFFLSAFPLR